MNAAKVLRRDFVIGLGLSLAGCSPGQSGGEPRGPGPATRKTGPTLRMGMMPKLVGISYFNACCRGADEAARELDIALTYDGPPVDKVELQTQMIDEWIALGFDIIAVAPND